MRLHRQVLEYEGAGDLSLRLLRGCAFRFADEVQFRYGMAELLQADRRWRRRGASRLHLCHGSDRSSMREVRRSPGARFRGWPPAHRLALLHEFGVVRLQAGGEE